MKLKIFQQKPVEGKPGTVIIDAVSAQRIPVDLTGKLDINRDGERPWKITPLADGVVVQWKDGYYVVLEPDKDGTPVPKQVSINDSATDSAPLADFMAWVARYSDSPLDFAPLGPYGLPLTEAPTYDRFQPNQPIETAVPQSFAPEFAASPAPPLPEPIIPPPTINELTVEPTSEEGLGEGNPDSEGSQFDSDLTDSRTVTGTIPVSDPNGLPLTLSLSAPAAPLNAENPPAPTPFTSGGLPVTWSGGGTNVLEGKVDTNGDGIAETSVVVIVIDNGGNFAITVNRTVDHPIATADGILDEDALTFRIPVTASNGFASATAILTFHIEDDSPELFGPVASQSVDEEGLLGGVVGGDASDLSGEVTIVSSSLRIAWGADGFNNDALNGATGDRTVVFTNASVVTTTDGVTPASLASGGLPVLTTILANGTLVGYTGAIPTSISDAGVVFHATLNDDADGSYSFTLANNLDHPGANTEDDLLLRFNFTAKDSDGDTIAGTFTVLVDDDGPRASIALNEVMVTHDESAGLTNDDVAGPLAVFIGVTSKSADLVGYAQSTGPVVSSAGSLTGADDIGATTLFSLTVANPVSGLQTTDGDAIMLTLESGIVVGRDLGGNAVFAISIDATTGVVSVAQYESIKHPTSPNNFDEAVTLAGRINAIVTVTDGDGDVATQNVGIGGQISFEDDGPTAAIATTGTSVTHDESAGLTNDDVAGPLAVFASVTTKSTDMVGFAVSSGAIVSSAGSATGEDEEGATTLFSLSIANAASGLQTTDGDAIALTLESGIVVGRDVGGNAVFAISINSATGVVSVAQYESIKHPTFPNNYDEAVTLAGRINAIVTVTDGDGDVATTNVGIGGQISFEDDGPTAAIATTGTTVTHDESAGLTNDDVAGPLAVFAGVTTKSTDMVGFAQSSGAIVSSAGSATGEDEEGATTLFSLSIANANSGLQTTDGDAITLTLESGIVVGRDLGGNAVFAISINSATGVVSVAQYESIKHPTFPGNYDEAVTLAGRINAIVTVTDGDGDVATMNVGIGGQISFEDDGPTAAIALTNAAVTHDESAGLTNDDVAGPLAVFAGVTSKSTDMVGFAVSAGGIVSSAGSATGEDEEGATTLFSLSIANVASGLQTTDGDAIALTLESGIVVGRDVGGNAVFAVSINSATGVVSVAQYESIKHPTFPGNYDEAVTLAGRINAIVTVTDGDGDVATTNVGIGGQIGFEDDGPTAAIALTNAAVTHDESAGLTNDDVAGPLAVFAGVTTKSTDMVGFAVSSGAIVSSAGSATGEDEEGATTLFSLSIANANSGLQTTDGDAIMLALESGIVVGRDVGGNAVFAVSINSATGVVSVAQYESIKHPTFPNNYDEAVTLAGKINAIVTVTDGDGDVATTNVGIGGQISFEDDGPTAAIATTGTTVTHDESAGLTNDDVAGPLAVFAGVTSKSTDMVGFAVSSGAIVSSAGSATGEDEEGATTLFSLSIANANSGLQTTDGDSIMLTLESGIVVGRDVGGNAVFAISINSATGVVSVAQYESIKHPTFPGNYDEAVTLAGRINAIVTVTDGDGDVATTNVGIGGQISFEDDGPTAEIEGTGASVTHDESAGLTNDDVAGPLAVFAGVTNKSTDMLGFAVSAGAVVNSGASSPGEDEEGATTLFSLSITNVNSGLQTTDGDAISLTLESGIVVGRDMGGNAVFAISINSATGVVSVAQYESIKHPTFPNNYDEAVSLGDTINAVVTVTDGDGDVATQTVGIGGQIRFEDDGPTAAIAVTQSSVTHDETVGLTNDDVAGPLAVFAGVTTKSTDMEGYAVSAAAVVSSAGSATGEDEEGATTLFSLSIANTASGLQTTDGDAITLTLESGIVVGRDVGGNAVFAISINSTTGVVSVAQYESIKHPTFPNNHDEAVNLGATVNAIVTVTDGDGDVATQSVGIGGLISFEDDGPTAAISNTLAMLVLDESLGVAGSSTNEPGDLAPDADDISLGNTDPFAALYGTPMGARTGVDLVNTTTTTGEDAGGTTTVTLQIVGGPSSGLSTTNGTGIDLFLEGNGDVTGRIGGALGTVIFAVRINSNGEVSVAQYDSLQHLNTASHDEQVNLAGKLSALVKVTDGDGDTATASTDIGGQLKFEDDGPVLVSPAYAVLQNGAALPVTFSLDTDATIADNYGEDNAGTVKFPVSLDGTSSGLTSGGTPIIYDVSLDGLTLTGYAGLTPVFVVTLNPGTATYTVDMNAVVDATTTVDFSNGSYNFVGGNTPWAGFIGLGETVGAPLDNNSRDLLLTPEFNDLWAETVNTNANQGGIGSGNSVGAGETFRVDFVTDLRGDPAGGGPGDYNNADKRDHIFDGHYTVNGSTAEFSNTAGSTIKITAFDDPDGDDIDPPGAPATFYGVVGANGADPGIDTITGVVIDYNGANQLIDVTALTVAVPATFSIGGINNFTVLRNADGTIDVGGVAGDSGGNPAIVTTIGVFTANGYNAVEYTYVGTNPLYDDEFKIGNFGASVPSTDPVSLNLPIYVVDGDGDTALSSIGITLAPFGQGVQNYSGSGVGVVQSSTALQPHIIGSIHADTLTGDAVPNVLFGGAGGDTLTGNDGNDVLIGGRGNDALNGGAGSDTFTWGTGDQGTVGTPASDTITGFVASAGGDKLDLRGLLVGETHPVNAAGNLANFLHFTWNGTNTILQISAIGAFLGQANIQSTTLDVTDETQVITFLGVNLVGANATQDAIISSLVSSGTLFTDTGVPPVILDLDGDGLEFTSLADSTAYFDFNGDGTLEKSAWVGADDAILVFDENGDRLANNGSEIVFADRHADAKTDLEGVRLAFDSNHDNVLDAHDTQFAKFGVWQDANADGVTDAGEYRTLAEAGIVSLNLLGDGRGYLAAGGDVVVFGEAQFRYADGGTGVLGDVALGTTTQLATAIAPVAPLLLESPALVGPQADGPSLNSLLSGPNETVASVLPAPTAAPSVGAQAPATADAAPVAVTAGTDAAATADVAVTATPNQMDAPLSPPVDPIDDAPAASVV